MVYSMTKVILLVLVILQCFVKNIYPQSTFKCGVSQISKAKLILHGSETVPGEWPWNAAVYHRIQRSETYACGGTLISERFILTAAHCAFAGNDHQLSNRNIFVRLGIHNLDELILNAAQQHSVLMLHLHADYSNNHVHNDIAILELATMAKLTKYVQPACLGLKDDLTGHFGTAIGWGMTENEEVAATLKSSRMPVIDYLTCLKSDRAMFGETLSEEILCAGYINGTSVCNGDSGSGLFFQHNNAWHLGGIVSYMRHRSLADRRCITNGYGAFTNVHMYLRWILSITGLYLEVNHFNAAPTIQPSQASNIASNTLIFFDCSTLLTCTECVSSSYPCDWCFKAHRCTHDTAGNCHNDILVTGISRIGPSLRSGPGFCPSINVTSEGQEIMIASGTKKQVKVKANIIAPFRRQSWLICQFNIDGRVVNRNAQLLGDMIYCDEISFPYWVKKAILTATFAIIWGDSKPLDNPSNIRVVFYRCKEMAHTCGVCLTLDVKYRCGWCSSSNTCEVEHQCQEKQDWLNSQQGCPEITDFWPKIGPIAGGTIIKILGKDLNSGSRVKAFLNQHPCEILSTDENVVTCRTTPVETTIFSKLRMEFDNGVRVFNGDSFDYVSNPSVNNVSSGNPGQTRTVRGIPAGGIKINVVGQNFFSIQKPKIYVYYRDQIFLNECKSTSNKEMQCLSPKINLHNEDSFLSDEPLQLEYGFIMDGVKTVKNLSSKLGSWFELYPDPVYYPFVVNMNNFNCEYLVINGINLDRATDESDVTVKIGNNAICSITSLSRHQLTCRPPKDQDIKMVNVMVIVGTGLKYNIGELSYASDSILTIIVASGLFNFLLFCVCLLIAYRWMNAKNNQ